MPKKWIGFGAVVMAAITGATFYINDIRSYGDWCRYQGYTPCAIKAYTKYEKTGDVELDLDRRLMLSSAYFKGEYGAHKDHRYAIKVLVDAPVSEHSAESAAILGKMLMTAEPGARDPELAIVALKGAAEMGLKEGKVNLAAESAAMAIVSIVQGEFARLHGDLGRLSEIASQGELNALAAYQVVTNLVGARLYLKKMVDLDSGVMSRLMNRATETNKGNPERMSEIQMSIAAAYMLGIGVERDPDVSTIFIKNAARETVKMNSEGET